MTNAKVFEELFYTNYETLCRQARKYIANQDVCEDIVQECFIKFWELSEKKNRVEKPLSYLSVSIRNRCISYLRKSNFTDNIDPNKMLATLAEPDNSEPEEEASPEEIIVQALSLLPTKCREIFELSRIQNKSYKEIAGSLNISIKTVENQMGKAIKIIREFVKTNPRLFTCLLLYFNLLS